MKKGKNTLKSVGPGYLEMIVLALLASCLTVMGYDRFFAPRIEVVDLKGYVRARSARLAAGEITEKQWRDDLDRVDRILDREAADGRTIILMKEVVLRHGREIEIQ